MGAISKAFREAGADALAGGAKHCVGMQALSTIALQLSTSNKGFRGPQTADVEGSCLPKRRVYRLKAGFVL